MKTIIKIIIFSIPILITSVCLSHYQVYATCDCGWDCNETSPFCKPGLCDNGQSSITWTGYCDNGGMGACTTGCGGSRTYERCNCKGVLSSITCNEQFNDGCCCTEENCGSSSPPPPPSCDSINSYADPNTVNVNSTITFTFTSNQGYTYVDINPGAGASNCGNFYVECGNNPKDLNRCWWRWTCTSSINSGSYTATFTNRENCPKSVNYIVAIPPTPTNTPTPTPTPEPPIFNPEVPVPNCKGLAGPTEHLQIGVPYDYTYIAERDVTATSLSHYRDSCADWTSSKDSWGEGVAGLNHFKFTPTQSGTYTLFGRVWNDGIAECRAKCVNCPSCYPCSGPVCSLTVNVDPPPNLLSWQIHSNIRCPANTTLTGKTRNFYTYWLPNPLIWHYNNYAVIDNNLTTSLMSNSTSNVYVGLETESGTALSFYGSPPHPLISFNTEFEPPAPMARWDKNLPAGYYNFTFLGNNEVCTPCPPVQQCPVCRTTSSTVSDGQCGTTPCNQNCWTTCIGDVCNSPPEFDSLILKNYNGDTVGPENIPNVSATVNQICDSRFGNRRKVIFTVKAHDNENNINSIQLKFNDGNSIESDNPPVNGSASFTIENLTDSSTSYNVWVKITDSVGAHTGWVNTNRKLKMWNCQVPITGTVYDGSSEALGPSCNATSFNTSIDSSINYTLKYNTGSTDKIMNVNSPTYSSDSNNPLIWGRTYTTIIDLPGSVGLLKTTDLGNLSAGDVCPNPLLSLSLNNSHVNPYSLSPSIRADFSATMDQDPWFQTSGGGVNALSSITDNIPSTCQPPTCQSYISINNTLLGSSNSSLIYGSSIDKGCNACSYGSPNNWYTSLSRTNLGTTYDYKYFYDKYFVSLGLGITFSSVNFDDLLTTLSSVGGTGVAFVNGDLTIDTDNQLDQNKFLMIIVKDNISINSNVKQINGVFVANGSITAAGDSPDQLKIDGVLYSSKNSVSLTRSFTEKSDNNSTPPILVTYRPDFLFSMPGVLTQFFTNWSQN